MKYFFTAIILMTNVCFAGLTNVEQEHLMAEFWQRADGKYCVMILDDPGHIFVIDSIRHSEECPCDITVWSKPSESTR